MFFFTSCSHRRLVFYIENRDRVRFRGARDRDRDRFRGFSAKSRDRTVFVVRVTGTGTIFADFVPKAGTGTGTVFVVRVTGTGTVFADFVQKAGTGTVFVVRVTGTGTVFADSVQKAGTGTVFVMCVAGTGTGTGPFETVEMQILLQNLSKGASKGGPPRPDMTDPG